MVWLYIIVLAIEQRW